MRVRKSKSKYRRESILIIKGKGSNNIIIFFRFLVLMVFLALNLVQVFLEMIINFI